MGKSRITIEGRFPSLNDFIGAMQKHRLAGAKMKAEETERARLHFIGCKKYKNPLYIQFTWYESSTRRDPDNVVFAKKFVLDGMVRAGVVPDDSQKWIVGFEDIVETDAINPRVVVEIAEVRDGTP